MQLTQAQKTTLKANIAANAATTPTPGAGGQTFVISTRAASRDPSDQQAIADWYNQQTTYLAWDTQASLPAMRAAASLAAYTPNDAVPASGSTQQITNDQMVFNNRAQVALLKQANVLFTLQGAGTVDASSGNLRQILSDAMMAIPTGNSGANQNAGWGTAVAPGAVRLLMMRTLNNVEKVFVTAASGSGNDGVAGNRGTNTNPDIAPVRGTLTQSDVDDVELNG